MFPADLLPVIKDNAFDEQIAESVIEFLGAKWKKKIRFFLKKKKF